MKDEHPIGNSVSIHDAGSSTLSTKGSSIVDTTLPEQSKRNKKVKVGGPANPLDDPMIAEIFTNENVVDGSLPEVEE